jgi:hypothetical protein
VDALTAFAVPGTAAADPDAAADLEALHASLRGPEGVLLGGDPVALAAHVPPHGIAFARAGAAADAVPAAWVDALQAVDAVWVPGEFAAAALRRSGLPAERLHVVAPVVDTERFAPGAAAERPAGARGCVFLAVLDWTRASGWDVLVRAWAEEFAADEDVSLVIRAYSSLGYTPTLVAQGLMAELDALGRDPGKLADLILEVSPEHAAPTPAQYRGADCAVVPARADAWGRRALEAMACGVPLIAADWGLTGELLGTGAAYSVPTVATDVTTAGAREQVDLAGARWGEPDVAALRRAMRAVAGDRLQAVETGLLGRVHVLERQAPEPPAARAPRRRAARGGAPGARAEDISFVLQGPIERGGRGQTAAACAAIRAHFPGAEIVLSTWEGTDAGGLGADVVVHSEDPGAVGPNPYNVNTNRQIVSSFEGVRAASRPLVAKVRSDMLFVSDALLAHWGRWEERTEELRLFERRVLVPNVFARRPGHLSPYPLHPSDWSYFGTRADLELLFDVPHMRRKDSERRAGDDALARLYHALPQRPTYTPEQWIWTHALRKVAPDTKLRHVFDLTPETLRLTELSFVNNLAILDTYLQYGVWCPKYPGPNRVYADVTLFQHEQWLELYDLHCRGAGIGPSEVEDLLESMAAGALGAEPGDVSRLRRAGFAWEAQLLADVLTGSRIDRDSTTGGVHRWHLDHAAIELARAALAPAAAQALERMNSSSRAATPA